MTYEERMIHKAISQILADNGMNKDTIKDMIKEVISEKVEKAIPGMEDEWGRKVSVSDLAYSATRDAIRDAVRERLSGFTVKAHVTICDQEANNEIQ